jgi:hypothetical protein
MASTAATIAAALTQAISRQSVTIEQPAIKVQAAAVAAAAPVMPEQQTYKKGGKVKKTSEDDQARQTASVSDLQRDQFIHQRQQDKHGIVQKQNETAY